MALAASAAIYEMYRTGHSGTPFLTVAALQFGSIFAYAPLTPFAFAFAMRFPFQRTNWPRRALMHLVAGLVFTLGYITIKAISPYGYYDSAAHEWTSAIWNTRLHKFRDPWSVLKGMFLISVVDDFSSAYLPIVLVAHVVSNYEGLRERETRATQLEGQLSKARLQTLKSQLQPHFLFNTLHSISSLMLTDVIAADRMMTALSDLLRMSLDNNGTQVTTLSREIEFLEVYLSIEKSRFEERLQIFFDIHPDCLDAQVPHLLLQPLVENAVRHGISKRALPGGEVRIVARNESGRLRLWIRDNGPGIESATEGDRRGLGLSITRERLSTLYGSKQTCELRNAADGGAEVDLRIPFLLVPQASASEVLLHG